MANCSEHDPPAPLLRAVGVHEENKKRGQVFFSFRAHFFAGGPALLAPNASPVSRKALGQKPHSQSTDSLDSLPNTLQRPLGYGFFKLGGVVFRPLHHRIPHAQVKRIKVEPWLCRTTELCRTT